MVEARATRAVKVGAAKAATRSASRMPPIVRPSLTATPEPEEAGGAEGPTKLLPEAGAASELFLMTVRTMASTGEPALMADEEWIGWIDWARATA